MSWYKFLIILSAADARLPLEVFTALKRSTASNIQDLRSDIDFAWSLAKSNSPDLHLLNRLDSQLQLPPTEYPCDPEKAPAWSREMKGRE